MPIIGFYTGAKCTSFFCPPKMSWLFCLTILQQLRYLFFLFPFKHNQVSSTFPGCMSDETETKLRGFEFRSNSRSESSIEWRDICVSRRAPPHTVPARRSNVHTMSRRSRSQPKGQTNNSTQDSPCIVFVNGSISWCNVAGLKQSFLERFHEQCSRRSFSDSARNIVDCVSVSKPVYWIVFFWLALDIMNVVGWQKTWTWGQSY